VLHAVPAPDRQFAIRLRGLTLIPGRREWEVLQLPVSSSLYVDFGAVWSSLNEVIFL
jgi:hypothetical protein